MPGPLNMSTQPKPTGEAIKALTGLRDYHDVPFPEGTQPAGEWTHGKLQGLLAISNEDRYVTDQHFENTLDEINAALSAERERADHNANLLIDQLAASERNMNEANIAMMKAMRLADDYEKQLAKAQAAMKEVRQDHADPISPFYNDCDHNPCKWCDDTKDYTDALDAAIAAAQQPLVAALRKCEKVLDCPDLHHARASKAHVEAWKAARIALANVKEVK